LPPRRQSNGSPCPRGPPPPPDPASDIEAARVELAERGVEVGEVQDLGVVLYAPFSDPDGNGWTLQQLPY
jgi:hypothetical protein